MNSLAASAAAFTLLCSASAAAGEDLTVRVPAPASYHMFRDEFRDYAHSYELGNGRRIAFSRQGQQFFVQLEGEARAEMIPLGRGVLATAAGARMEFSGDGTAVTIRHYEKLPMAVLPPGSAITMVAAR